MNITYPLLLEPVVKEKIWGGRMLETVARKTLPPDLPIGETWEAWQGCRIANGPQTGRTLGSLIAADARGMLGAGGSTQLPLLFKYIDACDHLSVQVHPDDAQARAMEQYPFGKTEAWYVLAADPGATLVHGFRRDVDEAMVRNALARGTLTDLLAFVPVQAGDVLFVPAGLVHAIGKGIVLAEIQQNSDTTYRFYDWDRRDSAGRPRDLHVEQSLRVSDLSALPAHMVPALTVERDGLSQAYLVACRYFAWERWRVTRDAVAPAPVCKFQIVTLLSGEALLHYGGGEPVRVPHGQTLFIPAVLPAYRIAPQTDACELLCAYVPDLAADVVAPLRAAGYTDAQIARLGGPIARQNDLLPVID
ncbi:MAG: class I mannose-6-phosphate isomerase [Chloroflexi bacterium]|nr:class I mannose-6-phosphate isomerase [Chloroflexota bacterium]